MRRLQSASLAAQPYSHLSITTRGKSILELLFVHTRAILAMARTPRLRSSRRDEGLPLNHAICGA